MQISPRTDALLHDKLPIDEGEKILGVYRHHWFAYVQSWVLGIFLALVLMALAVVLTSSADTSGALADNQALILVAVGIFDVLVLVGTAIPVYLRSQEQLVLTQEALLQVLRPSLFSSKIDQVNLQRTDDISVHQDFLGTILGYGQITVETPGEQNNYQFRMVPQPHAAAKEIARAKEDFDAALQSGRIPTTLGEPPAAQPPVIDPQQYQQFLQYQQMVAQQQAEQQQQASDKTPSAQD